MKNFFKDQWPGLIVGAVWALGICIGTGAYKLSKEIDKSTKELDKNREFLEKKYEELLEKYKED